MGKKKNGWRLQVHNPPQFGSLTDYTQNHWKGGFIDTGVKGLNYVFGGAEDRGVPQSMLTGILSAPKMGKTLVSVQLGAATMAATGKPALFIDLENHFARKEVYEKYIKPILERYGVDPKDFYLLRFNPLDLPGLMAFFGIKIEKKVSGGKVDIVYEEMTPEELPELNIGSAVKDYNFSYIALDGYPTMIKKFLGPITMGVLGSRRFFLDEVLVELHGLAADHNMVTVATFHAMVDTKKMGKHVMWGGFAPLFDSKNLITIMAVNPQSYKPKTDRTGIKLIDYREFRVERSAIAPEGLRRVVMLKHPIGFVDIEVG